MNRIALALCVGVLAMPGIALAGKAPGCDDVNVGQDVLAKFPNIRSVCQAVKEKNGGIYMLFVGEVQSVADQKVTVRVKDRSGKDATELTVAFAPDQKIKVRDGELRLKDLKQGMQLDFWVEHAKWGLYSKPGSATVKVVERKDL